MVTIPLNNPNFRIRIPSTTTCAVVYLSIWRPQLDNLPLYVVKEWEDRYLNEQELQKLVSVGCVFGFIGILYVQLIFFYALKKDTIVKFLTMNGNPERPSVIKKTFTFQSSPDSKSFLTDPLQYPLLHILCTPLTDDQIQEYEAGRYVSRRSQTALTPARVSFDCWLEFPYHSSMRESVAMKTGAFKVKKARETSAAASASPGLGIGEAEAEVPTTQTPNFRTIDQMKEVAKNDQGIGIKSPFMPTAPPTAKTTEKRLPIDISTPTATTTPRKPQITEAESTETTAQLSEQIAQRLLNSLQSPQGNYYLVRQQQNEHSAATSSSARIPVFPLPRHVTVQKRVIQTTSTSTTSDSRDMMEEDNDTHAPNVSEMTDTEFEDFVTVASNELPSSSTYATPNLGSKSRFTDKSSSMSTIPSKRGLEEEIFGRSPSPPLLSISRRKRARHYERIVEVKSSSSESDLEYEMVNDKGMGEGREGGGGGGIWGAVLRFFGLA